MQYNTQREKLILPEFGRNIQGMVDYCRTIPDRDTRNDCAKTIASIIKRLFSQFDDSTGVGGEEADVMVWNIISHLGGKDLDIDYPVTIDNIDIVRPIPDKVPYGSRTMKIRTYGRTIEKMIEAVAAMPDGRSKDEALWRVANHMKKQLFLHNKEAADDAIVARDLEWYSEGRLTPDFQNTPLREYVDTLTQPMRPATQKKKKNKYK